MRVGKEQVQLTTDASGMATAALMIEQRPGDVPVSVAAQFDGDGEYLPIEAPRSSLRVVKESTSVRWFDDVGTSGRHHRVLAASEDRRVPVDVDRQAAGDPGSVRR